MKPHPFEIEHLAQFKGKRIIKTEFVDTGEFQIPTLTFDDGTFAQIWCDPEGNGPGHLGLYCLKTGAEISPTQ